MTHNPNTPPSEQGDKPVVTQDGSTDILTEALMKISRRTSITFGRGEMSGREAADIASDALARHREQVTLAALSESEGRDVGREAPDWVYDIQWGPEGQSDYAWVYDRSQRMVATMRTFDAAKIAVPRVALSTPPAPEQPLDTLQRLGQEADMVGELVEALEIARSTIQIERDHLVSCCTLNGDRSTLEEGAKPDVERMEKALAAIDAALTKYRSGDA